MPRPLNPERKRPWEQAHKQQRGEQFRAWEQAHRQQRTERMREQRQALSSSDSDPQATDGKDTWAFLAFVGAIVGAPLLLLLFAGSSDSSSLT